MLMSRVTPIKKSWLVFGGTSKAPDTYPDLMETHPFDLIETPGFLVSPKGRSRIQSSGIRPFRLELYEWGPKKAPKLACLGGQRSKDSSPQGPGFAGGFAGFGARATRPTGLKTSGFVCEPRLGGDSPLIPGFVGSPRMEYPPHKNDRRAPFCSSFQVNGLGMSQAEGRWFFIGGPFGDSCPPAVVVS